MDNILYLPTFK